MKLGVSNQMTASLLTPNLLYPLMKVYANPEMLCCLSAPSCPAPVGRDNSGAVFPLRSFIFTKNIFWRGLMSCWEKFLYNHEKKFRVLYRWEYKKFPSN
jgi:hypothetical protein